MIKALRTVGRYLILMGRVFTIPERWRMFFRQYIKEVEQLFDAEQHSNQDGDDNDDHAQNRSVGTCAE